MSKEALLAEYRRLLDLATHDAVKSSLAGLIAQLELAPAALPAPAAPAFPAAPAQGGARAHRTTRSKRKISRARTKYVKARN